jgi:hypothetical protein
MSKSEGDQEAELDLRTSREDIEYHEEQPLQTAYDATSDEEAEFMAATYHEEQLLQISSDDISDGDAEDFAATHHLEHEVGAFRKAGLLLRNGTDADDLPDLTSAELTAKRRETSHKWHQPKVLYFTIGVCSLGAIEQGWAQ